MSIIFYLINKTYLSHIINCTFTHIENESNFRLHLISSFDHYKEADKRRVSRLEPSKMFPAFLHIGHS